jgi:hypothetical protein
MTKEIEIACIAAVPPTLMGLAALISSLSNRSKLRDIHVEIDGKFNEFLRLTEKASFAEGAKSEVDKRGRKKETR